MVQHFTRRKVLASVALGLGALVVSPKTAFAADEGKAIDVVICLDTSSSMDGLINSAKIKLWDIVNDLAKIKPTPTLRVALYSYGNDGYDAKAGWIRKEADLTSDLDEVYKKLNGLSTNGGTEYHTTVCREAVEQQKWAADKDALKIIFVCGNEAAEQDAKCSAKDAADKALAKGIIINPIFAGPAGAGDAAGWKEFARLSKGQFSAFDQDRGTVVVNAPQDKELAELGGKLNKTYVAYGKKEAREEKQQNQVAQDGNANKAGASAEAARVVTKGGGLYRNDAWDLVDRMKNDKDFDVKKLKDEELCDELKKLKPEEREKFVKDKAAERDAIQKKINDLATERQKYIAEYMKKNATKGDQAFDAAIRAALRQQAADKGIKIPE